MEKQGMKKSRIQEVRRKLAGRKMSTKGRRKMGVRKRKVLVV